MKLLIMLSSGASRKFSLLRPDTGE